MHEIEPLKKQVVQWFRQLRDEICAAMLMLELKHSQASQAKWSRKSWQRPGGGGGEMSTLRGDVFEKAGVNISEVLGEFNPAFAKEIPGTEESPVFWAAGLSLVFHPGSPLIPFVHMNTRCIITSKVWFGGGMDITSPYPNPLQIHHFHDSLRDMCSRHNPEYYQRFKEYCDRYFYLPHRREMRGDGGIFFDNLNSGDLAKDFDFVKDVGRLFITLYPELVNMGIHKTWSDEEKRVQAIKRGRYVEFNLLYDRGTRFGLMTEGNTEAILMSMPPEAEWE